VKSLAAAWGLPGEYELNGEFRPGDVRHLVTDATAIRALGWAPQVGLDEGLQHAVNWMRGLGRLEEFLTEALASLRNQGIVMQSRG
jgi:dTDP-L-rhamnose 4-epimerase